MNETTAVIGALNFTTTINTRYGMYGQPEIISVMVGELTVQVAKRARPNFTYTVIGPNSRPPDRVWMELWEIQDGKLVRLPDIQGSHSPQTIIPEAIEFPASPQGTQGGGSQ